MDKDGKESPLDPDAQKHGTIKPGLQNAEENAGTHQAAKLVPGSKVKVVGLKNFPKYNGMLGIITAEKSLFWAVTLCNGLNTTIRLRPENINILEQAEEEELMRNVPEIATPEEPIKKQERKRCSNGEPPPEYLAKFQAEIDRLSRQLGHANKAKEQAEKEKMQIANEKNHLKEEKRIAYNTLASKLEESVELNNSAKSMAKERGELEKKLKKANKDLDDLKQEYEERLEALLNDQKLTKASQAEMKRKLQEMMDEKEKAEEAHMASEAALNDSIEAMRQRGVKINQEFDEKISELESKQIQELKEAAAELEKARKEAEAQLQKVKDDKNEELQLLRDQLKSEKEGLTESKEEMTGLSKEELHDKKVAQIVTENASLKTALEELRASFLEHRANAIDKVRHIKEAHEAEKKELLNQIANGEGREKNSKSPNKNRLAQLSREVSKIKSEKTHSYLALVRQIAKLKKSQSKLEKELEQAKAENKSAVASPNLLEFPQQTSPLKSPRLQALMKSFTYAAEEDKVKIKRSYLRLKKENKKLGREKYTLFQQVETLGEALKELRAEYEDEKERAEALADQARQYKLEAGKAGEELSNLRESQSQNVNFKREIHRMREEKKSFLKRVKTVESESELKVAGLTQEMEALKAQKEDLEESYKNTTENNEKLRDEVFEHRSDKTSLELLHNEQVEEMANEMRAYYSEEKMKLEESYMAEIDDLQKRLDDSIAKLKSHQDSFVATSDKLKTAQEKLNERSDRITELESRCEEQERKLAFHQAESQGHMEAAAKLGALSVSAQIAEQDIKMKENEIIKLNRELSEAQTQSLKTVRVQKALTAEMVLVKEEKANLQGKFEMMKTNYEDAQKLLEAIRPENEDLKRQLSEAKRGWERARGELEETESKTEALQLEIATMAKKAFDTENELSSLKQELNAATEKDGQGDAERKRLTRLLDESCTKMEELRSSQERHKTEIVFKDKEITQLKKKLSDWEETAASKESKLEDASSLHKEEVGKLGDTLISLREDLSSYKERLKASQEKLSLMITHEKHEEKLSKEKEAIKQDFEEKYRQLNARLLDEKRFHDIDVSAIKAQQIAGQDKQQQELYEAKADVKKLNEKILQSREWAFFREKELELVLDEQRQKENVWEAYAQKLARLLGMATGTLEEQKDMKENATKALVSVTPFMGFSVEDDVKRDGRVVVKSIDIPYGKDEAAEDTGGKAREKGPIRVGDELVTVRGVKLKNAAHFAELTKGTSKSMKPGSPVHVTIRRGGKLELITVCVGARGNEGHSTAELVKKWDLAHGFLPDDYLGSVAKISRPGKLNLSNISRTSPKTRKRSSLTSKRTPKTVSLGGTPNLSRRTSRVGSRVASRTSSKRGSRNNSVVSPRIASNRRSSLTSSPATTPRTLSRGSLTPSTKRTGPKISKPKPALSRRKNSLTPGSLKSPRRAINSLKPPSPRAGRVSTPPSIVKRGSEKALLRGNQGDLAMKQTKKLLKEWLKNNELKVPFEPVEGKENEMAFEFGTREVVLVEEKGRLNVIVGLTTMSWGNIVTVSFLT